MLCTVLAWVLRSSERHFLGHFLSASHSQATHPVQPILTLRRSIDGMDGSPMLVSLFSLQSNYEPASYCYDDVGQKRQVIPPTTIGRTESRSRHLCPACKTPSAIYESILVFAGQMSTILVPVQAPTKASTILRYSSTMQLPKDGRSTVERPTQRRIVGRASPPSEGDGDGARSKRCGRGETCNRVPSRRPRKRGAKYPSDRGTCRPQSPERRLVVWCPFITIRRPELE